MKKELLEIIEEISAKRDDKGDIIYNRFNKRSFNKLINAIASDPEFKATVCKIKKGSITERNDITIGEDFRKWVRRVVESAGVDHTESEIVMSKDYRVPSMNWMYDMMCEAIYIYIKAGNRFDLPPKEDFAGSIYLKEIAKVENTRTHKNPQTKEIIGTFKITNEAHDELRARSTCPDYLTTKEKVD